MHTSKLGQWQHLNHVERPTCNLANLSALKNKLQVENDGKSVFDELVILPTEMGMQMRLLSRFDSPCKVMED